MPGEPQRYPASRRDGHDRSIASGAQIGQVRARLHGGFKVERDKGGARRPKHPDTYRPMIPRASLLDGSDSQDQYNSFLQWLQPTRSLFTRCHCLGRKNTVKLANPGS